MNAGDVFYFTGIADVHKWTIISDPTIDPEHVLMVNFTTYDRILDQACILNVGDHPFIDCRTCVEYPRAKVTSDTALETLLAGDRLVLLDPLRPEVLKRLRDGAMASTRIKLDIAQILTDQELVDEI